MNFKKLSVFIITFAALVFICNDGHCLAYDTNDMHQVVRQKCKESFQKINGTDNEYEATDKDINMCECSVYVAYEVFGAECLDNFLNTGIMSIDKYITPNNADRFHELNFKCMEQ